jgi:hypothetical protein
MALGHETSQVIQSEKRKTAYKVWLRVSHGTLDGMKMLSRSVITDLGF